MHNIYLVSLVLVGLALFTGCNSNETPVEELDNQADNVAAMPLEDTKWVLSSYGYSKQASSPSLTDHEAFIIFDLDEGRVTGFTSCNRFLGSVTVGSENIFININTVSFVGCPSPEAQSQRDFFYNALQQASEYEILGDELTITSLDSSILVFIADQAE